MKKLLILPAIVLGAASFTLGAGVVQANNPVTGLATGVVNAGGAVITGVGHATVGVVKGVAHGTTYLVNGVARTTTGALGVKSTKVYHRSAVHHHGTTVNHKSTMHHGKAVNKNTTVRHGS